MPIRKKNGQRVRVRRRIDLKTKETKIVYLKKKKKFLVRSLEV